MLRLYFILSTLFVLSNAAPGDLVQVTTPSGCVEGVQSLTENNNTLYAFRGIRYGQAPVGKLRFRAPVAIQSWSGVYNATEHGNECLQFSSNNNTAVSGAEDCLFINVYTTQFPANTCKQPLPVLVYIHGGGFFGGSGNLDLHGADRFLDHGVIVVSLNYRLGIFGFLSTQDNIVPGNYGIKDQVLALRWVKKNIASFGGDSTQVTIFGQSAGAASVHYLRQSKLARDLFHRGIADSGNTLNPWTVAQNARQMAFKIGLENNISTNDSKTLVKGLRRIDAIRLQQASTSPTLLDLIDVLNGLPYAPVLELESEEAVFTSYSYEIQENGNFNLGPLLHGFNSFEARGLNQIPYFENFLLMEKYNLYPSRLTPLDMNVTDKGKRIVGDHIRSYYFQNKSITMGPNFEHYFSDNEFVRGIVRSSQLQINYSNVYLYRFSFTGGVLHSNTTEEGVSHAEELQFLWLAPFTVQHTPEAQLTVERMVQMWSNFAKFGNPTPRPSDAVNITWPLVNSTGGNTVHYLDIGVELVPMVNPQNEQIQFWEEQYSVYGIPPYNTY